MVDIRRICEADIALHLPAAKRAGLSFVKSTSLYGLYENGKILGFTGIIWLGSKVILKNHYVLPEYRGRGLFWIMLRFSLRLAVQAGYRHAEVYASPMVLPAYLKIGVTITKKSGKSTVLHFDPTQVTLPSG